MTRNELLLKLATDGHTQEHIEQVLIFLTRAGAFALEAPQVASNPPEAQENTVPCEDDYRPYQDFTPIYGYRSKFSEFNLRAHVLGFYESNPDHHIDICCDAVLRCNPDLRRDSVRAAASTLRHEGLLLRSRQAGCYRRPQAAK